MCTKLLINGSKAYNNEFDEHNLKKGKTQLYIYDLV